MIEFLGDIKLVVDIITLIFENHWVMGMCMSFQCMEVLYVAEIVYQWIEIIKKQHPKLFRMLKYMKDIYEIVEFTHRVLCILLGSMLPILYYSSI